MAQTLEPVVAVEAGGFAAGDEAVFGLQDTAGVAGPEAGVAGLIGPAWGEAVEDFDGRPARRSFETGALVRSLYAEIRALAASQLADQWAANSLHPTALANEAVMRILEGVGGEWWDSPRHFLGAAAEAMRRVVVDAARRRNALKRGGGRGRHEISSLALAAPDLDSELLFISDALDVLARDDATAAEAFRLHYFGGLTVAEVSEKIGTPKRSVDRRLAYARSWLACRWEDEAPGPRREARRRGDA